MEHEGSLLCSNDPANDPILNQTNKIHHISKIYFNIALVFTAISCK